MRLQGVFLLSLCLLVVVGSCRRNRPSLVDKNEAPETELWYAPPDSTEYEYLVHLYWRGADRDGTAERFIWTVRDTVVVGELGWSPATRLVDFREGRITTRTDSVFSFTAFKDVGGVGVKKNRQAFYISAIDDNGVIDETPAAIEFVATIDELPKVTFIVHNPNPLVPKDSVQVYVPQGVPRDTVGMMRPFSISYFGSTGNGDILAYQFFPLSTIINIPGARIWSTDLDDTLRYFRNGSAATLPSGVFRFAAKVQDAAGAESPIDAGRFSEGVCQVVVNFDPDTQINGATNVYYQGGTEFERVFDRVALTDAVPDTLPYLSWIRLDFTGWDDRRDGLACEPLDPDECLDFQVAYRTASSRFPTAGEFSGWLPRGGLHDTDTLSTTDSTTFNVGTLEYELFARAVDENGRPDGTPASAKFVGNYKPVLDSIVVEDHLGNRVDLAASDTLTFNFWKGEGWPYSEFCDTVDIVTPSCPDNTGSFDFYKSYSFRVKAYSHDGALEADGAGVKSWQYSVNNSGGNPVQIGHAGVSFFNGTTVNVLDDLIRVKFWYPGPLDTPPDPMGDSVLVNLPAWFDQELTFTMQGRDTGTDEPDFAQNVFLNGQQRTINSFSSSALGRQTDKRTFSFTVRLVRP